MSLCVTIQHQLADFALDVSFEAPRGITALFGASGTGKTSIINAVSGLLLFSSQASYLVTSVPFLSKLAFITLGMVTAFVLQGRLSRQLATPQTMLTLDRTNQILACLSLLSWTGAIIAGRLIAYIF